MQRKTWPLPLGICVQEVGKGHLCRPGTSRYMNDLQQQVPNLLPSAVLQQTSGESRGKWKQLRQHFVRRWKWRGKIILMVLVYSTGQREFVVCCWIPSLSVSLRENPLLSERTLFMKLQSTSLLSDSSGPGPGVPPLLTLGPGKGACQPPFPHGLISDSTPVGVDHAAWLCQQTQNQAWQPWSPSCHLRRPQEWCTRGFCSCRLSKF